MRWLLRLFSKKEKPVDPMKYLIVGLGNMGAEYDDTRHNIGFDVIDQLADEFDVKLKDDRYGYIGECKHKGRTLVLLKPTTFMNLSGQAIRYWLQKKNIKIENLLVILDDLNIDFGKIRLRGKGSDGGHNGLKNIQQLLATTKYARLRLGIGNNYSKGKQVNYVLGKWTDEELDILKELLPKAADSIKSFASIGLIHTMNKFNG